MLHECQKEVLLVGEVIVDRGASDAGVRGDVRQGDLVERVPVHQLRERVEQGGAGAFAVLGERVSHDLRHEATLSQEVTEER